MGTNLTIAFVGILGTLMGIIVEKTIGIVMDERRHSLDFKKKIHDAYNDISQEIFDVLKEISSLTLASRIRSVEDMDKYRMKLSDLHFKYYNYLPKEVLGEINCLHLCLQYRGVKVFMLKDKSKIIECTQDDIITLFEDTVLMYSSKHDRILNYIKKISKKEDTEESYARTYARSFRINLQSRRVIRVMNEYFGYSNLKLWDTRLKKDTVVQILNKK